MTWPEKRENRGLSTGPRDIGIKAKARVTEGKQEWHERHKTEGDRGVSAQLGCRLQLPARSSERQEPAARLNEVVLT